MTDYHARARRSRGAYYQALLADQADALGVAADELIDFDKTVREEADRSALVVVDTPAPARGYVLLFPAERPLDIGEEPTGVRQVIGRIHMLAGQPAEAYRALLSQAAVQAQQLAGGPATIVIDAGAITDETLRAVTEHGAPYGLAFTLDDALAAGDELIDPSTAADAAGHPLIATEAWLNTNETGTPISDPTVLVGEPVSEPLTEDDADEHKDEDTDPEEEDKPDVEPDEEEPEFVCPECGKTFASAQGLGAHSRAHKG